MSDAQPINEDPDGIDCPFADGAAWGVLHLVPHEKDTDLGRRTDGLRPRIVARCHRSSVESSAARAARVVDYVVREVTTSWVLSANATSFAPDRTDWCAPRMLAAALRERPAITVSTVAETVEWLDDGLEQWARRCGHIPHPAALCDALLCLRRLSTYLGAYFYIATNHVPQADKRHWLAVPRGCEIAGRQAGRQAAWIATGRGRSSDAALRTWEPAERVLRMVAGEAGAR